MKGKKVLILIHLLIFATFTTILNAQCPDDAFILIANDSELDSINQKYINCNLTEGDISISFNVPEFELSESDINSNLSIPTTTYKIIDRKEYADQLYGFWLGTCIANWTGLITEMDKIGNIGEIKTGDFYTREDWSKADQPSIWGEGKPSWISDTIDFVFIDSIWGGLMMIRTSNISIRSYYFNIKLLC